MVIFPVQEASSKIISALEKREKDIVEKRFGLHGKNPATLEAIGKSHGITRERVRQIVCNSISFLQEKLWKKKEEPQLCSFFEKVSRVLSAQGSLKREDLLAQSLHVEHIKAHLVFLLHLAQNVERARENEAIHPYWTTNEKFLREASHTLNTIVALFEKRGEPLSTEDLAEELEGLSRPALVSFLEISKYIVLSHEGEWGLVSWPEVNPKTVRAKAYLVLKTMREPTHFLKLTGAIAKFQKHFPSQKKNPVLAQTVHNELIKDKRFVLVGRGTYALSEWGYHPGTVKQVLYRFLSSAKAPIPFQSLLQKTLEQRRVKESTVLLNLQDKHMFCKDQAGNYSLASYQNKSDAG